MQRTKIEYLTHTWNPIKMRCTPVSDGCRNCWHLAMTKRLAKNPMIDEDEQAVYEGEPPMMVVTPELDTPMRLRKPARIGLQFMGDLFHNDITLDFLFDIFQIVEQCQRHTFFVLTKRPLRAKHLLDRLFSNTDPWPFPNVWLGVSVEDQKTADERIPILLQIPAAHRWVSVEPMLSEVHLKLWRSGVSGKSGLDWVVCGGETGPKARPLHPDWVRSLRDQCQAAGVAFFFKAWGDYNRKAQGLQYVSDPNNTGHLLDGKEWREFPK